jgi:hypothetical protein
MVRGTPGITLSGIVEVARTHCRAAAAPYSRLGKWQWLTKIRGVQVHLEGRDLCLCPVGAPPQGDPQGCKRCPRMPLHRNGAA